MSFNPIRVALRCAGFRRFGDTFLDATLWKTLEATLASSTGVLRDLRRRLWDDFRLSSELLGLKNHVLSSSRSSKESRKSSIVPKWPAEVSQDPCGARESGFERLRESGIEKSVSEASELSGPQRNPDQVRAQNYLSGTACD